MGLGTDPNQTFEYTLMQDRLIADESKRRRLRFRYLSAAEAQRVDDLFDESIAADDARTIIGKVFDGIRIGLVGWRGFDREHAVDVGPEQVLSRADAVELRKELLGEMTLSELDKKKSVWQSLSTTASSASATGTAAA